MCEDLVCPTPIEEIPAAKLKFNHLIHKVGTTAQMICLGGYIYHFGNSNGIPVKQVNIHCTKGPMGKARYVDDFGNTPLPGCNKGRCKFIKKYFLPTGIIH